MDENVFLMNFASQFDDTDISEFTLDTNFRDLDEWSSIMALSVMAMCDEEYDVILSVKDMESAHLISDIFNIVKDRKK